MNQNLRINSDRHIINETSRSKTVDQSSLPQKKKFRHHSNCTRRGSGDNGDKETVVRRGDGIRRSWSLGDISEVADCIDRRGSVDDGLEGTAAIGGSMAAIRGSAESLSERDTERTDSSDYNVYGVCVTELDFQRSLKNERYHFLVAELLMETMEVMHAEEYSNHTNAGNSGQLDGQRCGTYLMCVGGSYHELYNDASSLSTMTPSSAENIALTFIDDLSRIADALSSDDGRQRTLPVDLQLLIGKLEKRSLTSLCLDTSRSYDMLSEIDDASKRPNLDNCIINFPVGGYPVLGPDFSLPSYIASRSPHATKLSATLSLQQNMCPGCKCTFSPTKARSLRLCHYYCLYFCSVCYGDKRMLIPSSILTSWNFKKHSVSRPAYDLLQRIDTSPIFALDNFSETLQFSLRVLTSTGRLRRQGCLLLHFIESCRTGTGLMNLLTELPSHWFSDPPLFSLEDFRLMKSGSMESRMQDVVQKFTEHIFQCEVCRARGFFCELCDNNSDIIFPFEIDRVHQCRVCGTCFHSRCYSQLETLICPRCERRKIRDQQLLTDRPCHITTM